MGGNFAPLVQKDEPWRLVHGALPARQAAHVGLNMWACTRPGRWSSAFTGRAGFAVLYLVAGLLGNLASL